MSNKPLSAADKIKISAVSIIENRVVENEYLAEINKEMIKRGIENPMSLLPGPFHVVSFDLSSTYSSFANGIRRTLVSELPVKCLTFTEKDLETDDEFILSDLLTKNVNLVTINQDIDVDMYNDDCTISLYKQNSSNKILDVDSGDIRVTNKKHKATQNLSDELVTSKNTTIIRLREGKYIKISNMRIVTGYAKYDASKFSLLHVKYGILDMVPYDINTKTGTRSMEYDPKEFRITFRTSGNIHPHFVMKLLLEELTRRFKKCKSKLETYAEVVDKKEYYYAEKFEVKVTNDFTEYIFAGEYITFAYMVAHRCYILDNNVQYIVPAINRYDDEIAIIRIKHADDCKLLIDAVDACIKDIESVCNAVMKTDVTVVTNADYKVSKTDKASDKASNADKPSNKVGKADKASKPSDSKTGSADKNSSVDNSSADNSTSYQWRYPYDITEDDFPYICRYIKDPVKIYNSRDDFKLELKYQVSNAKSTLPIHIISPTTTYNYNVISNLFTEYPRVRAHINGKSSPHNYYTTHKNSLIRKAKKTTVARGALSSEEWPIYQLRETLYQVCSEATNFNIMLGKTLYDKCSELLGRKIVVYDPFGGWGDRMLAAISSDAVSSYYCTDLNSDLVPGYDEIIKFGKAVNDNCSVSYKIADAKESLNQPISNKPDVILTSPPYYSYEIYNDSISTLSQFAKYPQWLENFLYPVLDGLAKIIKPDGYILIHAGATAASPTLPKDICQYMEKLSFKSQEILCSTGSKRPILVFAFSRV